MIPGSTFLVSDTGFFHVTLLVSIKYAIQTITYYAHYAPIGTAHMHDLQKRWQQDFALFVGSLEGAVGMFRSLLTLDE